MTKILEEIRARQIEAQRDLNIANQELQKAQQIQAGAQHRFNVWNSALQIENREEQLRQAAVAEKQILLPNAPKPQPIPTAPAADTGQVAEPEEAGPRKTDMVRDLLRRHPAGLTAPEIWRAVSADFKHRPYLYSVLKRLRDRDEVAFRRGKYSVKLQPKIEEVKEQQSIVH